jgi:hypothetical protein
MRQVALALAVMLLASVPASADERFAVIISGVSGSEKFAESQKTWSDALQLTLRTRLGFSADRITTLAEGAATNATRENVARTLTALKQRLAADDLLLIVLIGHGTSDGTTSKFNLVGPDMDTKEWKQALDGMPGRLVFVNTTSSSFQFVPALSGRNRVVIAATDSAAQRYATVFPQFFIEALDQSAQADADKNGRLSVWEAFTYASQAVKAAFEQKGTLVTERSIIDDNGDGVGREATAAAGADGVLAKTTFLDPEPATTAANAAIAGLEKQRVGIEAEIEQLKDRKGQMPAGQYEEEFERLAIELARISAKIRAAK